MNDTTGKKRRKKWPMVLLVILLLPIVLLLLAPSIASSGFVRGKVLSKVNENLDGQELSIQNWSLSWFGASKVEGLVFTDQGQPLAKVAHIDIPKGLLSIARSRDLGLVRVVDPVIAYTIPEPPEPQPTPESSAESGGPSETTTAEVTVKESNDVELPVSGLIEIVNGTVTLTPPGDQLPVRLYSIETSLVIDKALGSIVLKLNALNGEEAAPIEAVVNIAPPEGKIIHADTVKTSGSLSIKNLNLGPVLDIAASFSEAAPKGSGSLATTINFETTGKEAASFSGFITTAALKLTGGALGADAPDIGEIKFVFEGAKDKAGVRFKETILRSVFANIYVGGDLPVEGAGTLNLSGSVQLAKIATAFPATLKLQEGLALNSGELEVRADLSKDGKTLGVDSRITIDKLAGTITPTNGLPREVTLEDAVTVVVKGTAADKDLNIEKLELASSFLNGSGSGNLDNLKMSFDAGLAQALAEASKFVDLGPLKAEGDVHLELTMVKQAEDDRRLKVDLSSESLFVAKGEQVFLPRQAITLGVVANTDIPEEGFLSQVKTAQLSMQSKIANGRITAKNVVLPKGEGDQQTPLTFGALGIGTTLNLDMISGLIPAPEEGPPMKLGGTATISGGLQQDGTALATDKLSITAKSFSYQKGEQHYMQDELVLSSGIRVDPEKKQATLTNLSTTLAIGTINAPSVNITNWEDLANTLAASIDAQIDLQKTMATVARFTGAKEVVPVTGSATLDLKMKPVENGSVLATDLTITDLHYRMKNDKVIQEKSVKLNGQIALAKDQGTVHVSQMSFQTDPFSLSGTAALENLKTDGRVTAKGAFAYDLVKITPYIKLFTGQDIAPIGKHDQPFELDFPLGSKAGNLQAPGYFRSAFQVDELKMYGLDIRDLKIPLVLSNQQFSAALEAGLNEGELRFYPTVMLDTPKPTLTIPTNSLILSKIKLNNEISNDLLGKIHPLFKGASVGDGQMDLSMDYLEVPTGDKVTEEIRFAGTIALTNVQLAASGMLDLLMGLIKVDERAYTLNEEEVRFVAEKGRITCSPLQFKANGKDVVLHGSIGFDQTMAYKVSLPVTEELVGTEAFKYLEGQLLSVPIGGTVSKPRIDRSAFQSEVANLVKDALKKGASDLLKKEAGKFLEGKDAGKLLEGLFK